MGAALDPVQLFNVLAELARSDIVAGCPQRFEQLAWHKMDLAKVRGAWISAREISVPDAGSVVRIALGSTASGQSDRKSVCFTESMLAVDGDRNYRSFQRRFEFFRPWVSVNIHSASRLASKRPKVFGPKGSPVYSKGVSETQIMTIESSGFSTQFSPSARCFFSSTERCYAAAGLRSTATRPPFNIARPV
jgi:hypothetical protein